MSRLSDARLSGRRGVPRSWSPVLASLAVVGGLAGGAGALAGGAAAQEPSFDRAASAVREDLEASLTELSRVREEIASERLPLDRRLRELERSILELRNEVENVNAALDTRSLELARSRRELEGREESVESVLRLLGEYRRNWEPRLHVTELPLHAALLERAAAADDHASLAASDRIFVQQQVLEAATDRLESLVGGMRFDGAAITEDGHVEAVRYALFGPVALYAADDGSSAGLAEQRLGSLEPSMVTLSPELSAAAREIVETGSGSLPLDPTLGGARQMASAEDSLVDHVKKGGIVMIPILCLAGIALLLAIVKWIQLARVPRPSRRRVKELLAAVEARDFENAATLAKNLRGPTGSMLQAGVENLGRPRELVEEVMYEHALENRLRLSSLLPFIAVAAAAAPLLGLLGTVTGIINTFQLITVFGTGDAKTLSSGISEALITTEFGLVVAIPALLLHAWLSRRAQRHVDDMDRTAVSFLNRIPSSATSADPARHGASPTAEGHEGNGRLPVEASADAEHASRMGGA